MATETEQHATNGQTKTKRKVGRPKKGDVTTRYDGFRDNVIKLFQDNPSEEFTTGKIQEEHFPEVSKFAIAYHLAALKKKRILKQTFQRGPYTLAPISHRNGEAPLVTTATKTATPRETPALDEIVPTDEYTRRHLKRIEARLQEAHEFDIAFLRRLAQ